MNNSDNSYVVVVNGPSGVIFHEGQKFSVLNFTQDNKIVDLVLRSRYVKFNHEEEAIPISLWIDIKGSAASINEAINVFSNAGLAVAHFLSFCANAAIGDLEPHIAFENTVDKRERAYFHQLLPDERIRPYIGRFLDIPSAKIFLDAIMTHKENKRLHRAMVHYAQAIKHWKYGKDTFSLAHLFMGMESLTPVAKRKYLEDKGVEESQLPQIWGIKKKEIDSEVRHRILFKNDTNTFQDAKEAEKKYKHSFDSLSNVFIRASSAKKKTAEYLRESILELSDVDASTRDTLLKPPYDKPFSLDYAKYIHGSLIGSAQHLGRADQVYPSMKWKSKPSRVIKNQHELLVMNDENYSPMIAETLDFKLSSIEIWGGPESEQPRNLGNYNVNTSSISMESLISELKKRFIDLYLGLITDIDHDRKVMTYAICSRHDQIPLVVFSYMRNINTQCYEVLNNYANIWAKMSIKTFIEQMDTDIIPRIKEIQKMFFIYNISAAEYVIVEYHKQNPMKLGPIGGGKRHIYLWDIMQATADLKHITQADLECWQGLIFLRNKVVHSNSISDETSMYMYPECKLEFQVNKAIEGSPLLFPRLTNWLRTAIKDWIFKMYSLP